MSRRRMRNGRGDWETLANCLPDSVPDMPGDRIRARHTLRCLHDGAYCHHDCEDAGDCWRKRMGAELSTPHPGYPKEQYLANRTHPWSDRELIWWRGAPFGYSTRDGEVHRVYLAGGRALSWDVFRLGYPGVKPPREVRR